MTAMAKTLDEAIKKAYKGVSFISWDKVQYRKDI
ncbi:MAG: hypothetical protein LBI03_06710 [Clostridiales bacterium]|nr:hypothetical protein [Clostridiales bacterium]